MANKKKREQRAGENRPQGRPQPHQQPPQRARQRRQGPPPGGPSRSTLVTVVAGVAVLVVVILIVLNLAGAFRGAPTVGATSVKGSPDATVVVEEFSDFQCPFCARFALDTFPRIDEEYVQTGKVRWVFKHLARIGEESKQAAIAAECAGEQGQFWPYHDKLFANQQGENRGAFSSGKLESFAGELGLDRGQFDSCLDSGKYSDLVERDRVQANQKLVNGTPTFFINGRMIEGARPFADFERAIEAALVNP